MSRYEIKNFRVYVEGNPASEEVQQFFAYLDGQEWHRPDDCEIDDWELERRGYYHLADIEHDDADCPYYSAGPSQAPSLTTAIDDFHLEHDSRFPRRFCQHPICHSFTGSVLDSSSTSR